MPERDEIASLLQECRELELAGEVATALRKARQAQALAAAQLDPHLQAMALARIARVQFRLGQYEPAKENAQQALNLAESVQGDSSAVTAEALLILGNCAAETNSLVDAETCYRRAADICREHGYPHLRKRALHSLGTGVYLPRGRFDLARTAEEEALQITEALHELDWTVYPLTTLAWIHLIEGNPVLARPCLDRLGQAALPASLHQGYHQYFQGLLALDEGAWEQAQALFKQALSFAEAIGEPGLNVDVRLGMSNCYRLAGKPSSGRTWADDACARDAQRIAKQGFQGHIGLIHPHDTRSARSKECMPRTTPGHQQSR